MAMQPPDDLPEFLVDELNQLDDDTRLTIATFTERGGTTPSAIPERIKYALAMQNDDVVKSIGEYARQLAKMDESDESETGDSESESKTAGMPTRRAPSDDGDDTDDDESDRDERGLFSGGW